MANIDVFFDWFYSAFADKETFEQKANELHEEVCNTTGGWASPGKIEILHNALLCMDDNEQYLEIGSYTGRSLAGALRLNTKLAQVIDPFDLFLPDGVDIHNAWKETISKFNVDDRVTLHKTFAHTFNEELPSIGVCYFDGDHDSGHTYEALKKFEKHLSDRAIVIVDDYYLFGGYAQKPYPGYSVVIDNPVEVETNRWIDETPEAQLIALLPWENCSALIRYERN